MNRFVNSDFIQQNYNSVYGYAMYGDILNNNENSILNQLTYEQQKEYEALKESDRKRLLQSEQRQ